ncbi:ABC transporter substrate-binding protein [Mesorhizobium neociceri]|uniref:Carbohydrate ABC transporter substrate-binding protein n=1 Tax=Mesorhizobium neociceri TaxID=1307853 RepID=A0A838BD47_9HYPH|nr:ABC transporter substrate-binding protein [Mesorhizobium neociceri]MBA1143484.1 carbohydrate ABC transporter substrate-binding protein [Mesorhizobium neociceri]
MKSAMTAFAVAAAACTLVAGAAFAEPKTNLLHQWSTGSDAQAIAKLGEMFTAKGGKWEQTSIAGHTANTLAKLRADVIAGNAPPAVQLKGPEIAEWNETGMTADLDELAASEGWEKVVAPELLPVMKPTGKWVAAPMNIHRINWLWASPKVMQAAGVTEMPKTWAEFNAACDKIVASGKICISHSTADWTDSTVFEVVLYGQDIDLYRKAFVQGDVESMRSPGMVKAFEQMRLMTSKYMDPGMVGRDWDSMSALVGKGDAAFHIMGDWTIGLLTAAGFKEGTDYVCAQAPTDWGKPGFILNSDSVVFFKQKDQDYIDGQKLLASLILSADFQTVFNQAKGSIPARLDIDLSKGFNPCQQISQKDLQASIKEGTLVRSMAHNMTIPQKMRGAIMDSITEFVATPDMSAEDGANAMADAAEAQK